MLPCRAFAFAFGLTIATLATSPLLAENACEGMSHYEYDYGECYDKSSDFNSVMEKAYDDSYHDQREMLQSSKRFMGGGGGGRHAIVLKAPSAKLLFFTGGHSSLVPAQYAKTERDPKEWRKLERMYASLIPLYEREIAATGLPSHFLPAARWYFVRAAYVVYNGDRPSDATSSNVLVHELAYLMTRAPILEANDAAKQFAYERYAVTGEAFALADGYAKREHRRDVVQTLRQLAQKSLIADLGVDPAHVKIDQIPCLIQRIPGMSCAQDLQFLRSMFPG